MNCQRNVNPTLPTQLPHKFSYIVAILGHNHFESPNILKENTSNILCIFTTISMVMVLCRPQNFGRHCNPYFNVIMITVLIMNVIFWVVNFKTQNYFVISSTQNVYLRLSMYDCSNFVHSCRIFGISELQTV
jgi:hypothetical protein